MNISVNIKGLDEAVNNMLKYSDGDKLKKALASSGELVRSAAAAACPVDTGRLKGSIVSTVEGNSAIINAATSYAVYVEFGTGSKGDSSVAHTTKKSWTYNKDGRFYTTSGQAPQPFLVPALKNNTDAIVNKFKEVYSG